MSNIRKQFSLFPEPSGTAPPRPVVWLDCDGPLADIMTPTLEVINDWDRRPQGATDFTVADVTDWDLFGCLKVSDTTEKLVRGVWQAPGFCLGLQPTPGAKVAVTELHTFADVRVVTTLQASAPTWAYDRLRWLAREFKIHHSKVVFTEDKSVLTGDLFVDDKAEHVRAADMPALLWDRPWNRSARDLDDVRVAAWTDIVRRARKLGAAQQQRKAG